MSIVAAHAHLCLSELLRRGDVPKGEVCLSAACGWALQRITGEALPSGAVEVVQKGWFLEPHD